MKSPTTRFVTSCLLSVFAAPRHSLLKMPDVVRHFRLLLQVTYFMSVSSITDMRMIS